MSCQMRQCIVEAKSMLEGKYFRCRNMSKLKSILYYIIYYIIYYYVSYITLH